MNTFGIQFNGYSDYSVQPQQKQLQRSQEEIFSGPENRKGKRQAKSAKEIDPDYTGGGKMAEMGKKGPKRPRSVVWYYFDKIPNEAQRAKCKLCGATCHHANNTSNLFKHLRVKHPMTYKEAEAQREAEMDMYLELKAKAGKPATRPGVRGRKPKALTPNATTAIVKSEEFNSSSTPNAVSISVMPQVRRPHIEKHKQTMNKALLRMLSVDLLPGSIVEGKGFREFVKALDPRFELPTKKTILKTMLPDLAEETKNKIKLEVVIASYFALTVDSWSYCENQSFITVTAHFIKGSWEMCSVVLDTFDCTEDCTAESIALGLKRIVDEWGITDRVNVLISNNLDPVLVSAAVTNGWEHLPCFGHTINLVVLNALKSVAEIARIQKKASEAVAYFEKSIKASDTLAAVQQQHNLPVHKLKQEVASRWNSIFAMLERMVEQYEAVNTVLCFLGKDHMCLCDDEVEMIRHVIEVLRPFEAATKELCTEQYTLMSKIIPIATLLQQVTSSGITNSPSPQSALKNALLQQMQQHFANLETNYSLAVATLLDPRFKKHAITDSAALETAQHRLLAEIISTVSQVESTTAESTYTMDTSNTSFWGMFDRKVSEAGAQKTTSSEADNESRRYFKEANISRSANPLLWWKLNEVQFPNLKVLAQKYLCIPATAISSERLFSKQGEDDARKRDLIKPSTLHNTIFLNKNLQ